MAKTTKIQATELADRTRTVARMLRSLSLEVGVLINEAAAGGTTRCELEGLEQLVMLRERVGRAAETAQRAAAEFVVVGDETRVEA